jgi:asparagine synthase (glutamine-hydrolysing)
MHYFHPSDLAGEFSSRMALSVADRLLSDVELGVYLSGGVDSKTVGHELSHHLRAMARPPLKSFTVGFAAGDFDETREALSYAAAQGFQPHVLEVAGEDLAYSYPIAVAHSENLQPYTNGAAKWWLSRFARRHVHGVLTGDGADELLCGYPSFRYAAWWKFALRGRGGVATPNPSGDSGTPARVLRILERLPLGTHWRDAVYFRRFVADALDPWLAGASSAGLGDDFVDSLALWGVAHPLFGQIRAIARGLFPSTEEADAWLTAQGPSVRSWFSLGFEGNLDPADPANALLCWQSYFCRTHLPVQVLNWVGDRMEMANTLEGRTPFLSRRLAQFVQGLGDASLVSGFQDKAILRQAYIPKLGAFARTPKRQFGAPFLDNEALLKRFPAESAFSAIGMDGEAVLAKLKGESGQKIATTAVDGPNGTSFQGKHTLGSKEEARAAQAAYDRTHLASALQTAVSFGIVHRTLVEGKAPVRDSGFEEKVLAKERISG